MRIGLLFVCLFVYWQREPANQWQETTMFSRPEATMFSTTAPPSMLADRTLMEDPAMLGLSSAHGFSLFLPIPFLSS